MSRTVFRHARPSTVRLLLLTCAATAASMIGPTGAWAAPGNDDFAAATPISSFPFSDTADMTGATVEPSEPRFCVFTEQTAWYAVTPTQDGTLAADTTGSTTLAQVTAYRADASGFGGLSFLSCANFGDTRAVFEVQAGQTYYLQTSSVFGGGSVRLNVEAVEPPSNDNFAAATNIGSTPFSDTVDLTGATAETNEPSRCQGGTSQPTAWYAFTPANTGSYVMRRSDPHGFWSPIAAYTGDALGSLTEVACSARATYFYAEAGTTYYLQVAAPSGGSGRAELSLDVAPAASASFIYHPGDPSIFDTVQFWDTSFDEAGIVSRTWNLGDGLPTTDCCPTRRYAADGNYPAQLSIATTDRRTATATQSVPVKTHDVEIAQLTVPKSARVGRTKQITVGVTNSRYAEMVQVSMLRSVAGGGFEEVGQVTQGVQPRARKRTTNFSISYTFSPEDALIGKVTFKAIATILSARDAHPADNDAIAPPTRVTT